MTCCPKCGFEIGSESDIKLSTSDIERFWKNTDKNGECWNFKLSGGEYGRIGISGRHLMAHRVSWVIANGQIPNGKVVRHKCDNPRCVNPSHLQIGTHAENMADMVARNRHCKLTGEKNHKTKLSDAQVTTIRGQLLKKQKTILQISKEFGVSFQCIYQIAIGKSRKNLGSGVVNKKIVRKLTDDQIQEIKNYPKFRGAKITLGKKYGVHRCVIGQILNGRRRSKIAQQKPKKEND